MPVSEAITLFVSVDTEEDSWEPAREHVTVENIRRLGAFEDFCGRMGVLATYFVTYRVAAASESAAVLREIRDRGRAEIGGHLHPWNTPPMSEPLVPRLTMTKNLAYELQLAKLTSLTDALREAFGCAPVSFRAGRWGLGPETVRALVRCGYRVDGSVTPTVDWSRYDDGPNFENAPLQCHYLDGDASGTGGTDGLLEVPNSFGYSRGPFRLWNRVHGILSGHSIGRSRLLGMASRTGLVRKIVLTPELSTAADMLLLSRRLVAEGVRHLQLFLHSPTLQPGLTPYTPTAAHVTRLYHTMERYLDGLRNIVEVRCATMKEAPGLLAAGGRVPVAGVSR